MKFFETSKNSSFKKSTYINLRWIAIIGQLISVNFVYLVLKFSDKIEKVFGKSGIGVIRKIFGVILMAIAVKLFTSNIQGLF